jgi:hypothetical protein
MAEGNNLEKAELQELDERGKPTSSREHWVKVQFNPETLKISYANQVVPPASPPTKPSKPGDQKPSSIQYVGKGTTKLSVTLWFDVTALQPQAGAPAGEGGGGDPVDDVQALTQKVIYFITPTADKKDPNQFKPPSLSFVWGSFKFDGIVEALEQSLEYFDPKGKPLRANISLSLTRQEIVSTFNPQAGGKAGTSGAATPGTKSMTPAKSGDTVQGLASSLGLRDAWQSIAEANGIENPRQLAPGQLIDMSARGATPPLKIEITT